MSGPFVSIIMRSFNEGWALRETLPALRAQEFRNWELIVIDSGSTDGSVELIRHANPRHFVQIQPHEYNPARVMNRGMELARSEFGIFLNADATPQGVDWLRPLVEALQNPRVAAVFGRQIPRPDCQAVYAHDYERCFGKRRESTKWEHFFSMVSSGLRKDIWAKRGFLEAMQYSEDDEYTRWCRAQGYEMVYVPESVVMHSHNYTPQQVFKRSFGEAKALAAVWTGKPNEINWPRTVCLGWLNDARRDLRFCAQTRRLHEWPHALRIRWQQRRAKLIGFREGWNVYRNGQTHRNGSERKSGAEDAAVQTLARTFVAPLVAKPLDCASAPLLSETRISSVKPSGGFGSRFTLDGSTALENRLSALCTTVASEVQTILPRGKLEALVLGGGYGRGQGGVLKTASGDRPYNDLEFYVFLRGNRLANERLYHAPLTKLGERLSPEAGLHVEFKVDSLARLRRSSITMFSYDLVCGHKVLTGNEAIFNGCEHHRAAQHIPLAEATRLLFNRCTGLLMAKELLRQPKLDAEQSDFIGRNLAKAQLALGDAILVSSGLYHWDCRERHQRLEQLAAASDAGDGALQISAILRHHEQGVKFKLHPARVRASHAALAQEHRAVGELAREVWLWLESRRLNQRFSTVRAYAFSGVPKCNGSLSRNLLINARAFGMKSVFDPMAQRYPRERLLNALPLLLWDEPLNDLRTREHLQNQLRTTASDWQSLVAVYKTIWPRFS